MAISQTCRSASGDIQVTPLQMAQSMGVIANGGTFYQTRLVQQVQTFDNQIVTAYQVRARRTLDMSPETLACALE